MNRGPVGPATAWMTPSIVAICLVGGCHGVQTRPATGEGVESEAICVNLRALGQSPKRVDVSPDDWVEVDGRRFARCRDAVSYLRKAPEEDMKYGLLIRFTEIAPDPTYAYDEADGLFRAFCSWRNLDLFEYKMANLAHDEDDVMWVIRAHRAGP